MRTTKIKIKNMFGITEQELDGSSIELTGSNGTGKTSVIDAVRYALTNNSNRDYIIKNGETEGEIIVETDAGLFIDRKKRSGKADYKSVKDNGLDVSSPESFLKTLFTELQLNPVEFTRLSPKEQNRIILDLIEFDWDLNWIKEQFGEIPPGVDYGQNILQVLFDIQSENGEYFQRRQNINRDIRNKRAFIADIAKDIPDGYNAEKWSGYDFIGKSDELSKIRERNSRIQRAKLFLDSYQNKIRALQADSEIKKGEVTSQFSARREALIKSIEQLKAEIAAANEEIGQMQEKIKDKFSVIDSEFEVKKAQLDKDMSVATDYADKTAEDVSALESELSEAKEMIKHLNEYGRMKTMQHELDMLIGQSAVLTEKIELARTLPGEILKSATLPIDGLTIDENGMPLIHGLPVSNLSEGEKLDLCVDVAISNPNALQIILLDGTEKLSDENRNRLYEKCRSKGLQFIAARTTNDNELQVTKLC